MSIRSLVKRRSWPLVTLLLPALTASCSLEVAGIQGGSSVSSGGGQPSSTADTGQGAGGATMSSGGAIPTSTSSGTSLPVGRCGDGTIAEIFDAFEDNVTNTTLWSAFSDGPHNETSVIEDGGAVDAKSDGTKGLYAGYYQLGSARKLNDCSAFIEVREVADRAQPVSTFFKILDDSDGDQRKNVYSITQLQGRLSFEVTINGKSMVDLSKDIPYDPAEHHWWGFREDHGKSFLETSRDGKTWTTQATFATPAFASKVRITFGIGATAAGTSEAGAVFDNLNVPPP